MATIVVSQTELQEEAESVLIQLQPKQNFSKEPIFPH